jgi:hypothetical protein
MVENRVPGRKRGAQPGNLNALKHGFYSRLFQEGEVLDLEARGIEGMTDEIAMLRVWTRRVMALGDGVESLERAMRVLAALGTASLHLSHLLRLQQALGGKNDDFEKKFLRALDDVQREFNIRR